MPSQDVWKSPPVSYRTSALWGRCPKRELFCDDKKETEEQQVTLGDNIYADGMGRAGVEMRFYTFRLYHYGPTNGQKDGLTNGHSLLQLESHIT